MTKRIAMTFAALPLLLASGATAQQLTLTSLATAPASEETQLDLGEPGPSAGDMVLWHSPVVDEDRAEVGTSTGVCVRASTRADVRHCEWTIELADGSLTVSGVQQAGTAESVLAVVGGTGAYDGATGRLTMSPAADFSEFTYVIEYRK